MKNFIKPLLFAVGIVMTATAANAQRMMSKEFSGTMQLQGMYRESKLGN